MKTERIPLTPEQARLLLAADDAVRQAQDALQRAARHANELAAFALAGAGVQGTPTKIDTDTVPPVLVVEVAG